MPIFQQLDPLGAAAEAVGSFLSAKRAREVQDAALAHQTAREGRQDFESDRTFGIQQQTADDAHSLVPGQLQAQGDAHEVSLGQQALQPGQLSLQKGEIRQQGQTFDIGQVQLASARANEAFNKTVRPLEIQMKALEVRLKRGEITGQQAALVHANLQNQIDSVTARHAEVMQGLKEAEARANITQSYASANASNASAYRTMNPVEPRLTAGERNADKAEKAMNSLSPGGKAFFDMVSGTNNPATKDQALSAINASRLPDSDKAALRTIYSADKSSFVSVSHQDNQDYRTKRDANRIDPAVARTNAVSIGAIKKNRKFIALPADSQAKFETAIAQHGYDTTVAAYKGIVAGDTATAQASGVTADEAKHTLSALGVTMPKTGGGWFGL